MIDFQLRRISWEDGQAVLSHIRETVFIKEQGVPAVLEWDGLDQDAIHLLAEVNAQAIGCVRLLADGHIGRMAVLAPWRDKGIGRALLVAALSMAKLAEIPSPYLMAQIQAIDFYRQQGFIPEGEVFMDAGIPHRRMRRSAPSSP